MDGQTALTHKVVFNVTLNKPIQRGMLIINEFSIKLRRQTGKDLKGCILKLCFLEFKIRKGNLIFIQQNIK